MTFVLNLHLVDRPLYFLRHGESEYNLEERIGGDPCITKRGEEFSKLLNKFFEQEKKNNIGETFIVNTSTLKRSIQTASFLDTSSNLFDIKKPVKMLDEINGGI
eukprot:scpid78341/ scgid17916/ 6-phosphofructo-2-kinase/fructose-2,6-bisphosphatase 4; 6PF-2-K/Fru-2,6-P2ase testis-type isozyme; 6-phosphofructo-2-kinase; Fructose-2,6-bisphosphatase